MIGLGTRADGAGFDFDKVADVHVFRQLCAGTQPCVGANAAIFTNGGIGQMAIGVYLRTSSHRDIFQHTIRPHAHTIAQRDLAFEHTANVDRHIPAATEVAPYVKSRRVSDSHSRFEQGVRQMGLVYTVQLRELQAAVDAMNLIHVRAHHRFDRHARLERHRHQVGDIELILRVFVIELGQPLCELIGGKGKDAGVNFADLFLSGACIAVLNHACDFLFAIAHHASVTRGVIQHRGEHGHAIHLAFNQRAQGFCTNQRHIAQQHQSAPTGHKFGQSLLHSMAGSQLRGLVYKDNIAGGSRVTHALGFMARNHDDFMWRQRARSIQHMRQQ